MNVKRPLIVTGAVAGAICMIILIAALYIAFVFFAAFGGFTFLIPVPKPEITYGEFPFRLTYELNGEIKVIEDAIVCEFDGFKATGENGKYRQWKSYLKSGSSNAVLEENKMTSEQITLLDVRHGDDTDSFGNKVLKIYFFGGNGHYYMGDSLGNLDRDAQDFTYVSYQYQKPDGTIGHSAFEADEAWEKFKIRLIGWEIAPPIQNNFKCIL